MASSLTDTEALLKGGTYAANTAEFWRERKDDGSEWSKGYATGAVVVLQNVLTEMFGPATSEEVWQVLQDLSVRVAKSKGARKGGLSRSPAKVRATRANAATARAARKLKIP